MVMNLMEAMERKREFRSFVDWHKKVWFSGLTGCEFALDLAESGEEERAYRSEGEDKGETVRQLRKN